MRPLRNKLWHMLRNIWHGAPSLWIRIWLIIFQSISWTSSHIAVPRGDIILECTPNNTIRLTVLNSWLDLHRAVVEELQRATQGHRREEKGEEEWWERRRKSGGSRLALGGYWGKSTTVHAKKFNITLFAGLATEKIGNDTKYFLTSHIGNIYIVHIHWCKSV